MGEDDERHHLEQACRELAADAGPVSVQRMLAAGAQGRVWQLSAAGGPAYAIKVWRADYRFRKPEDVEREYVALLALHRAVSAVPGGVVTSPAPLIRWDWGYAMTLVAGRPLMQVLPDLGWSATDDRAAAAALVPVLRRYHAEHGGVYGDFHAGNVLVDDNGALALIDPAPANLPFFTWSAGEHPALLAVDVAYWLFRTSGPGVRQLLADRSGYRRRARLARSVYAVALADVTAAERPALARDVARSLRDFRHRLADVGPREAMVATLSVPLERRLLGRRLLGRPEMIR